MKKGVMVLQSSLSRLVRVMLLCLLLLPFLYGGTLSAFPNGATFHCHTCSARGFQGAMSGYGLSQLWGSRTTIKQVPVIYESTGYITDEMWFTSSIGWVEVGVMYMASRHAEFLFWGDKRPGVIIPSNSRSCTFVLGAGLPGSYCFHQGPTLSQHDYNQALMLSVVQTALHTYAVTAAVNGGSRMYGTSSGNAMNPDTVEIGQEISGDGIAGQQANAGRADFVNNQVYTPLPNYWTPFVTGQQSANNPPWGGWAISPSASNNGGDWYTCTNSTGVC